MRPRVFPAEDQVHPVPSTTVPLCFNEAAGIPRGRRRTRQTAPISMTGFNEAAGIPRGRQDIRALRRQVSDGFNEAAGIPRGRRIVTTNKHVIALASMRPRVFPAEDAVGKSKNQTPSVLQ